MKITKKTFGVLSDGKKSHIYTLKAGDLSLSIAEFGGQWVSLMVPSRTGKVNDVLLGYPTLEGYTHNAAFFGATVGRFGNRIGNARFSLEGRTYNLYKNDGEHSLHGGRRGFDKLPWRAEPYEEKDGVFIRLELDSPDGDEGFPGNLKAVVSYGLTKSNEIIADYQAKVDAPSPVNLTNHAYFNLAGEGEGDILSHKALFHASSYVAVDSSLIPTGKLQSVQNGPFDFRIQKPIGKDIEAAGGYDHCFVVDGLTSPSGPTGPSDVGTLRPCAEITEERSGRIMRLFTTQPGVQFYTGNFLSGVPGKPGSVYGKHTGFCLETQHFPDSPNRPEFPSAIFGPGRDYHEKSVFAFDW
ncbi:aldose 1-epimerase [Spirochaetia bacterium]|nr:aldose 1-epimerase [Spirochaetia bacterium]